MVFSYQGWTENGFIFELGNHQIVLHAPSMFAPNGQLVPKGTISQRTKPTVVATLCNYWRNFSGSRLVLSSIIYSPHSQRDSLPKNEAKALEFLWNLEIPGCPCSNCSYIHFKCYRCGNFSGWFRDFVNEIKNLCSHLLVERNFIDRLKINWRTFSLKDYNLFLSFVLSR